MTVDQDPYSDIRPYKDTEVPKVLNDLLHNEELIGALCQYRMPKLYRWLPGITRHIVRIGMARQFGEIESVRDFQMMIAGYMEKMISRSTSKVSCSGVEHIDPDSAYLFISNHRDIAMDPAFVNWMLYHQDIPTLRIAIGDNLLTKDYVSDLMRLNKSFIVRRSAKAPREMMAALTKLSSYIDYSIQDDCNIWIAQREGRAKDGNDATDPALLKMLYMSQRKERSFAQAVKRLKIVPVSISYQYDPCDCQKARELAIKAQGLDYQKTQHEDVESIVAGITGFKGRVHVHFGDEITDDIETPEALAQEIDRQIRANYQLHDSNLIAAGEHDDIDSAIVQEFEARFAQLSDAERDIAYKMYANPVHNQRSAQSAVAVTQ
ncbi:MAG: 1-acyl-sn-glycerol-3-phosphate acyltransferase [Pseudomonadales bacterium]